MKYYPKRYEDICSIDTWEKNNKANFTSRLGSLDDLVSRYRDFYQEAHRELFSMAIKEIWLEQQVIIYGRRKINRVAFGAWDNILFGRFTKAGIGISQRVITCSFIFLPMSTYFIDFFPDFLIDDPFKNPEKYEYPYKHVTLDFLLFVHQVDERLELLAEAEKRKMSYAKFINWATNWMFSRNVDVGDDKYELRGGHYNWLYIKNKKLKRSWQNKCYKFKTKKCLKKKRKKK